MNDSVESIKLSQDGEINQSIKYFKKASSNTINKLCNQYEERRLQKANKFLTGLLGRFDATKDPQDKLRRDVEGISSIIPFLPYIGLLSDGITVGKHVSKHMYNKVSDTEESSQKNNSEEGVS